MEHVVMDGCHCEEEVLFVSSNICELIDHLSFLRLKSCCMVSILAFDPFMSQPHGTIFIIDISNWPPFWCLLLMWLALTDLLQNCLHEITQLNLCLLRSHHFAEAGPSWHQEPMVN